MGAMDLTGLTDAYRGRRVLVTGNTGFKGSWLALWLAELGARVSGLALAPAAKPNHWDLLRLEIDDHRTDIRDTESVKRVMATTNPEIVFHLAAQPLVRRSYQDPVETWSTNVVGTANVLEACRGATMLRAIVVVTSDKCYAADGSGRQHRETDRLGGHDPYSASKAAAELVAASYRNAFFSGTSSPLLATARAGNVIGGGDWAEDRLIPDLVRAVSNRTQLIVRSPSATRPWQHVIDCLAGYLLLGARLLARERSFADAWNFGPDDESITVASLLGRLQRDWPDVRWHLDGRDAPYETEALALDSSKARERLGWQPQWPLDHALAQTAAWYRDLLDNGRVASREQLAEYRCTTQARDAAPTLR